VTDDNARANSGAELLKAYAARRAARALADLGLYDDAASRLYYAAFHLISAALLSLGVQAQTHRAAGAMTRGAPTAAHPTPSPAGGAHALATSATACSKLRSERASA
jgi:hypothetical protein